MVRKDDVVLWFSRQPSHQRLDVLCKLASICLPLELRFVNSCVDYLVKKSAPITRDSELLAQYEKMCHPLADVDLHQEDSRRKLVFTLTLLSSSNRIVASSIYRILYDSCSDWTTFGLDMTVETCLELCLIFTMALHHPAFTFEEKMSLGSIYTTLSRQYGMRSIFEGASPSISTPSPQPQHSPPDERLVNGSNSSSSSSSGRSSKSVQNRRHRTSPKGSIDSITNQLKDLLGEERLPKGWRHFEKYTPSELMSCTDQEYHSYGLSSNFISHLRKVLSSQKLNGLLITAEDNKHAPSNKSIRPVKTCMGPPNVQPAFNNSRINEQKEQPSRSSSSSGSSSEACSPPSSPTDSTTIQQRKAFMNPQPIVLSTGTRLQSRVPSSNPATLRGATANFLRPASFPSRQQPPVSRATSQPREFVSLPYPQTTQSFIVDSSTPPPHLSEAPTQPVQSPAIFSYQSYLPMANGEGAPSYQPPFTFIGPPPASGGNRPPHEMMYPTTYVVQSQIIAQPIPGSNANGRPLEMSYLPAVIMTRSEMPTDYSRPPPAGSGNVSCFNCGSSGHRGTQCQQLTFDEIIKPSPA